MKTNTIIVKTFPRIHVTLIDLAGATHRRCGGAGFLLDTMPAIACARMAFKNRVDVAPDLDQRDRHDIESYIQKLSRVMNTCFHIRIPSMMPQHIGLGSKTAALVAIGIACNIVAGNPLSQHELISISGRGGTSGVGVNASLVGGFVVDGGHKSDNNKEFRPSSISHPTTTPPLLVKLVLPTEWIVHLFLPIGRSYSGDTEAHLFENNTPIPPHEVHEVLAAVYHGIVPAIAEADIDLLRIALREIQGTGFKRREVAAQSHIVGELLDQFNADQNMAAGMSSMGPLVYAITSSEYDPFSNPAISEFMAVSDINYLGCFSSRNEAYEICEREGV